MKKCLSLLLAALLLLSGCGVGAGSGELSVCRVIAPDYQTNGQLICSERVTLRTGENQLDALLRALNTESSDTRAYNPLSGIQVLDCSVTDGLALLELSEAYLERTGIDKTLCDACCTLTLCALADIDRVSIAVGGVTVTQNLSAADLSTDITGSSTGEQQVCLYYADETGQRFLPEYRSLSASDTDGSERYVVEALLQESAGRRSPLPEGTELLSVTRKGRSCTINLSSKFLDNRPQTAVAEFIAVYSLVNSLASLGSISEVLITVEGESVERYVNLSLSNPLAPQDFLHADSISGEAGLRLYFALDGALFGAPCLPSDTADPKQELLDELMTSPGFGCYESLFSENDKLEHLGTFSGICRVSLSRSFFERRTGQNAALALDALTLTLLSFEDVNSVLVTYPDGTAPRLPDRDLSQPILHIGAEIIQ